MRRQVPYNRPMFEILTGQWRPWRWAGVTLFAILTGCVTDLPSTVESTDRAATLVVGRVTTVITGETSRM